MRRGILRGLVVLVAVLVIGNLTIVGLSMWVRHTTDTDTLELAGVPNGVAVDERVWRSGAPTAAGYRALVDAGVTTVIDLRSDSERGASVDVVHCGAGVGRTGAMVAASETALGEMGGAEAARRNLAVGPPSLEQLAFAVREGERPGPVVTALSRVLDSPRRIWHNLT